MSALSMRRWVSIASVLWLAGCASLTVRSYVVPDVELARYRTYAWEGAAPGATGDARLDNNEFFDARVRERIDTELARRGLEKQSPGVEADLLVRYDAGVTQKVDFGTATQPSAQRGHDDPPAAMVYDEGALVIDVIDNRTKALVWRGWAEGYLAEVVDDQRLLEARIDEVVSHIFRRWGTD